MILITKTLMVFRWIFIAGVFLGGCSTLFKPNGLYNQPVEIKPYTNSYLEYKEIFLNNPRYNYAIEVYFYHLKGKVVGECHRINKPFTRRILIDHTYWQKATDDERLTLVFHELGHCDLNYGHQESILGIMNPELQIKKLKHKMIEDFFLRGY